MDLTFTNGAAEFRAESHYNLHLEGAGAVGLYRRTAGQQWDLLADLEAPVIDEDVPVTIPADYRVTCTEQPTMAVVTFNE